MTPQETDKLHERVQATLKQSANVVAAEFEGAPKISILVQFPFDEEADYLYSEEQDLNSITRALERIKLWRNEELN